MSRGDPHNNLFQLAFSRPATARAHLEAVLPAAVQRAVQWDTLELQVGTFTDPRLRQLRSDILYRVRLKDGGHLWLFLLLEHQSTPEPLMALRLLQYMAGGWGQWLQDSAHSLPLPAIVPIVVYRGVRPWRGERQLQDLVMPPGSGGVLSALRPHIPAFEFILQDLSSIPDDALRGEAMRQMTLLLLKWVRHPRFRDRIDEWIDGFQQVYQQPDGLHAVEALMRYIQKVQPKPPPRAVYERLAAELPKENWEVIVSWESAIRKQAIDEGHEKGLEEGREKGLEEGREEGLLHGRRLTLLRLLRHRFGALPAAVVARLEAAGSAQLDRWEPRLFTAASPEAMVADDAPAEE